MQDFKFESIERMKEATLRIQIILENRSNMINNNTYNIQEDNILITRMNELLLESYEDLQKLPVEVSQFARELFEENWQTYEADSKAIHDKYDELIEISNKLHEKIVFINKINKRLSILCGLLVILLISSVITIITLVK
jgi:predicted nucleotidyltransferase